ncbi:MAG: hypothetical protein K2K57_07320 [Oscillospiraceae bacterium]|nr:hypothetical protein [Oscillospiraceae bacterium]
MKLILNNKILHTTVNADDIYNAFDGMGRSYNIVIIEDDASDSYMQAVCSMLDGVLEARIYENNDYKHYRAEICSEEADFDKKIRMLDTPAFTIKVPQKQVINSCTIKKILIQFLTAKNICGNCKWVETDL